MKINVKIIPNSARNKVVGWHDNYLKIKINASPEKGKANKELISFLADKFNLAKSSIKILKGQTNRIKLIELPRIKIKTN